MLSLISSLGGQIGFLVSYLDNNNYNSVLYELSLLTGFGVEGSLILLQTCLEQINLGEGEVCNLQLKLDLLAVVIRHLIHQPNFATVVCEALKHIPPPNGDFLSDLSKLLKLTLPEQIGLGFALSDAEDPIYQQAGITFCEARIAELHESPTIIIPELLVEQIFWFLHQSESLSKHLPAFLNALPLLQPNYADVPFLSPSLLEEANAVNCLREFDSTGSICEAITSTILELEHSTHVADVIEELGYGCTVDVEHCKELLSLFVPLAPQDVARIASMVARTHSGLEDSQGSSGTFISLLCDSSISTDLSCMTTWDIDVLVTAIKQLAPDLSWESMIKHLDHEGFVLADQKSFSLLMAFYVKGCQDPFPLDTVCGSVWKNTEGQVSFLRYAVIAPPDVFSFAHSPRKLELFDGLHRLVYGSPNHAWISLDLLDSLCRLAEAGLLDTIHSLLEYPIKNCPELLLIGLAQVQTEWNLLQTEYFSAMFPAYLSNNTNASAVLHQLAYNNLDLVVRGMVDVHAKDPSSISKILDVCQELKALSVVLDTTPFSFAIDLAALASRREYLNLEKWLNENLLIHRDCLFQACLNFLRERALAEGRNEMIGGVAQRTGPVVALSLETTAIFFKALQAYSGQLSSRDLAEEMRRIHGAAVRVNPRLLGLGASEQTPTAEVFANDIEEEANSYFQKIYTGRLTIEEVVEMLEGFTNSSVQREQEIFGCMIQCLFEEYRFFPRYPDTELQITAVLFGSLIKHQLISSITLGIALRCVLDALRKPLDSKMFSFGMTALEQFKERLVEWPQYCNHLLQISHMREDHSELVDFIERALVRVPSGQVDMVGNVISGEHHQSTVHSVVSEHEVNESGQNPLVSNNVLLGSQQQTPHQQLTVQMQLQQQEERHKGTMGSVVLSKAPSQNAALPHQSSTSQLYEVPGTKVGSSVSYQQSSSLSSSQTQSNLGYRTSRIAAVSGVVRQPSSTPGFGHALNIETLVAAAERRDTAVEAPNLEIQDKVAFIINNLVITNYEAKAKECMEVLKEQYYPWFARYMVMKRASIEPNYHDAYLKFLDSLNSKALLREIVKATYENCKVLLRSDLIKSSSEERSLLKNLGSWLGKLTIGRNQTLRAREIDPKSLIIEAYEKGLMIAVIPFTSKILEPCSSSLAYQPPNPWTMGILSLLAEIYALPNLKMNLKFDIEVLFKNLTVDMKDVKPAQLLRDRQREVEGNPDFSNKDLVTSYGQHPIEHTASVISQLNQVDLLPDLPTVNMHASIPGALSQLSAGPASQQDEEKSSVLNVAERINALPGLSPAAPSPPPYSGGQATPFPNLASYVVVNQKLAGISQQLQLTRIVPVGMERAIREIINPVVDRSVNIACCTTKEIILKDFVMEGDDNRTMNSANIMVACLAGSLAHVTCKEPLRVAMASNFRTLLQPHVSPEVLDQAVLIVTNDNLDLGCAVIEKAATEKALRELEELFGTSIANRRKQKDSYYDASYYSQGHFARLPEALRPKPGRLSVTQQRVFEDFARLPWQSPQVSSVVPSTPVAVAPAGAARAPYSIGPGQASLGVVSSSGAQPPSGLATLAQVTEVNAEEVDIRAPSPSSFTTSGSTAVPDMGARHSQDAAIDSGNIPGTMTMTEGMNSDLSGASKIPGAPVSMPTSPTLSAEQVVGVTSEPSLSTGEAIESYNLLSQKLDAAISMATGGSYSALAPDHEIKVFVTEIQEIITQCISRDEAALAISQKVFKRLYENAGSNLHISAHLAILESIRDVCKRVVKELTSWVVYSDDERRYNREITVGLIKSELINLNDYNIHLAKLMDGGRNTAATEFAIYIVKTCVVQDAGISATELYNVIDALSKVAQRPGSPESLQQLVEIAKNTSSSFSQGVATVAKEDKLKISKDKKPISSRAAIRDEAKITSLADPVGFHEQVVNLFDEWARICNSPGVNDKAYAVYISQLQQSGMLKGDDVSDRFFRLLLELSVIQCLSTDSTLPVVSQQQGQYLSFAAIDMYAKLVVLLVKYYAGEPSMSKVNLLVRVLTVTARVITRDAEEKKTTFHPRPYFRLFLNWLMDFNTSDPLLDSSNFQVLSAFANTLLNLQPLRVPGWSFAWLELISHRMFMPKLLLSNAQKGWPLFQKLLVALFKFMDPYLRNADLSDPVRLLYKGTLRVLLVLLHDFPEFLCDYHFSFCDVIPPSCIQMRNLILSAFPRNMRLPDPFTPNLKVDLLPEISQAPRILSDVENALKSKQLKTEVDEYLKTRQHASLFSVDLKQRLTHSQLETLTSGTRYNVPLINSLVLYVGMQAIQQLQNKSTPQQLAVPTTPITHSAPMDIFQRLIMELDTEGRYLFLNAVANQLRYPNNHTHYFSCVLLYLFAEANQEIIQEQITRVLLERLIVNRPHPWGLLITFIELIKNPRYSFWTHGFTRCAPEIERLFESVARSCMGPPPKPSDEEITSVLNSEGLKG